MRLPGHTRTRAALAATASAALLLGVPAVAGAVVNDTTLVPRTHFTMAADGSSGLTARGGAIPNIDVVKSTIRKYYNAPAGEASKTDSPYIAEMNGIENAILSGLPNPAPAPHMAVVFDADDTTLWTYDMEDKLMHFNFDIALQGQWVHDGLFPATPGMVDLVKKVADRGYDIYGITGRGESQEADTLANLSKVGYTEADGTPLFNADNFYTKFASADTKPAYLDCASGDSSTSATGQVVPDDPAKCSTVEYKAGTRKHIQDLGETILLNIGDQFSDLQGGYSVRVAKLPNPTYYLPSADLKTPGPGEAAGSPKSEFTMAPDGSSGLTEGGAGIPNIDSVKSTIRTYYGATSGLANKTDSPYISEMTKFSKTWTHRLAVTCARVAKRGQHPAVVFDADDTTLWTYDMEDGNPADDGMQFNFNPTLQDQKWVQLERFPATPGMVKVVRAAAKGGCKIVGVTGRGANQREATLGNLAKYYYDKKTDESLFRKQYYFTKWAGATPPAYVNCAMDSDATKCSTIEYKSSTRKYVEKHFGFRVVANFGDQFSDLIGGSSDRAVKLPNPTYYLP